MHWVDWLITIVPVILILWMAVDNPLDDGRVKGHVSLMDVEAIGSDEDEKEKGH